MGINFVICDDQKSVVRNIAETLDMIISSNKLQAKVALKTTKPEAVIEYAENNKPEFSNINAYVLDIDLNASKNGLELAKKIRTQDPISYILFVTAHLEYGMLTFKYKLRVFDYLLKPVDYLEFKKTIKSINEDYLKLVDALDNNMKNFVNIISGYKEYKIPINDIIYVESRGAKATIHTSNNIIETYTSLKKFLEKLNSIKDVFYRTHKTYIVNMERVKQVNFSKLNIEMDTEDICLIARANKLKFKKYLNESEVTIHYNE